jgi:hypothetical protein
MNPTSFPTALEVEFFHVGTVVPNLEQAMRHMTTALGTRWAQPVRRTGPIHTPAGPVDRDMVITYSRGGPTHVELIEYLDDTAYHHLTGGPPMHHIGYWSKDFHQDIARLDALGFPSECSGIASDGGHSEFSYHRNPHSGLWIELVDDTHRHRIQAWTAG